MFKAHGKFPVVPIVLASAIVFPFLAAICADRTTSSKQPAILSIKQVTYDGVNKSNLLSDGANLYISESQARLRLVAKISLQTANRSVLPTTLVNPQALDLSPDHKKILVSATPDTAHANELWTLPLGPGTPSRLGDLNGRDAAWSHDGHLIAFGRQSTVYSANADGSGAHEVYSANGSVFAPRVSLDGKRIRFTVGNAGANTTSIWEVNTDGSNPHALFSSWANASAACCGIWAADGRYYIFQVTQGTLTTLWAAPDSGTSAPVRLTDGPTSFGNVSISGNSNDLLAIGVKPTAEAIVYEGGKLAPILGTASATDVDFSADGKWATYVSIPERELWRCRADGSDKLKLASAPDRAALPRWSPNGKQIAYVKLIAGQPAKIAIISRDGGPAQNLLDETRSQMDGNWSTDGRQMMIGSFAQDKNINIRLINLNNKKVEVVPGSEGIFSPRWSPDGKYIAALSPDSTKVLIFDFAIKQWATWLSEPAGAVSYPVWSADSKSLYFDDLVTGIETIQKAKLGESKTETMFTLPNFDRFQGPFGLWSGRTPDGKWMFVRDRSSQEVYQLSLSLP